MYFISNVCMKLISDAHGNDRIHCQGKTWLSRLIGASFVLVTPGLLGQQLMGTFVREPRQAKIRLTVITMPLN